MKISEVKNINEKTLKEILFLVFSMSLEKNDTIYSPESVKLAEEMGLTKGSSLSPMGDAVAKSIVQGAITQLECSVALTALKKKDATVLEKLESITFLSEALSNDDIKKRPSVSDPVHGADRTGDAGKEYNEQSLEPFPNFFDTANLKKH